MSLKTAFNRLIKSLREDFPAEMARITVVDTGHPDARNIVREWYDSLPDPHQTSLQRGMSMTSAEVIEHLASVDGFAQKMPADGQQLLGVNLKTAFMFADRKNVALALTLLHEAGHLIADDHGGQPQEEDELTNMQNTTAGEIAADVFATLYARKLGLIDREDVDHVSNYRGLHAWAMMDIAHFTGSALDAAHVRLDDAYYLSLSPKQIKMIAKIHAITFKPMANELQKAYETFNLISPSLLVTEDGSKITASHIETLINHAENLPKGDYTRAICEKAVSLLISAEKIKPDMPIAKKATQLLKGPA